MVDLKIATEPHLGLDFVSLYMVASELPDGVAYMYVDNRQGQVLEWQLAWLRLVNPTCYDYAKLQHFEGKLSLYAYLGEYDRLIFSDELAEDIRYFDLCDPEFVEKVLLAISNGFGGPPIAHSRLGSGGEYHHIYVEQPQCPSLPS